METETKRKVKRPTCEHRPLSEGRRFCFSAVMKSAAFGRVHESSWTKSLQVWLRSLDLSQKHQQSFLQWSLLPIQGTTFLWLEQSTLSALLGPTHYSFLYPDLLSAFASDKVSAYFQIAVLNKICMLHLA